MRIIDATHFLNRTTSDLAEVVTISIRPNTKVWAEDQSVRVVPVWRRRQSSPRRQGAKARGNVGAQPLTVHIWAYGLKIRHSNRRMAIIAVEAFVRAA